MGISDLVVSECRSSMLIRSIDICCHMVHAEQFEEKKLKQVDRELKKVRIEDGNSSKTRLEVQDNKVLAQVFQSGLF